MGYPREGSLESLMAGLEVYPRFTLEKWGTIPGGYRLTIWVARTPKIIGLPYRKSIVSGTTIELCHWVANDLKGHAERLTERLIASREE